MIMSKKKEKKFSGIKSIILILIGLFVIIGGFLFFTGYFDVKEDDNEEASESDLKLFVLEDDKVDLADTPKLQQITSILKTREVQYLEFLNQNSEKDIEFNFFADTEVEVYVVTSRSEYDHFKNFREFEDYYDCRKNQITRGIIDCKVTSGGIMVYNPNDFVVSFQLSPSNELIIFPPDY